MIVVEASVAINWFVTNEPLFAEAGRVLAEIYVALASLTEGVWLTADERAVRRIGRRSLARLLGS